MSPSRGNFQPPQVAWEGKWVNLSFPRLGNVKSLSSINVINVSRRVHYEYSGLFLVFGEGGFTETFAVEDFTLNATFHPDTDNNLLGHRTNKLAAQRLQFYRGYIIIEFHNLVFEANSVLGSRLLDERNVARILKIFEIEGYGNLEPEYRVTTLIGQEILSNALLLLNLTRESLIDLTN
jgi:hypothetical protein